MYLLYADESGNTDHENFVLAGVAVFEGEINRVISAIDQIAENYFPGHGKETEIHISGLRDRAYSNKDPFTKEQFYNLLHDLVSFIQSQIGWRGFTLFASVIHRPSINANDDPYLTAFEGLVSRFGMFLDNQHRAEHTQKGLLIIDKSSERRASQMREVFKEFRIQGTHFGTIVDLPEVPLFADSSATRLIQLADVIANIVFRRYEFGDSKHFDKILPCFCETEGVIHGLGHLISKKHNCMCQACLSKRLSKQ